MLKLSSSREIRIDGPVLSVSWSFVDHSMIIQALTKGLIEHEASDTGGVPRWKSSCPDRLAEATDYSYETTVSPTKPSKLFLTFLIGGPLHACCVRENIRALYRTVLMYSTQLHLYLLYRTVLYCNTLHCAVLYNNTAARASFFAPA